MRIAIGTLIAAFALAGCCGVPAQDWQKSDQRSADGSDFEVTILSQSVRVGSSVVIQLDDGVIRADVVRVKRSAAISVSDGSVFVTCPGDAIPKEVDRATTIESSCLIEIPPRSRCTFTVDGASQIVDATTAKRSVWVKTEH